ncbi:MAG: sigma-70 family RNA polymerase sigma factor [Thermoanaerobaculales bacterium]|nr:sigma-70 family RNA polymerase sigma factor [Thermoanaerobaculales bacterium]
MREQYTEDRKLVARLVKGDERAFDFFVDQYYPRLFRFAIARIGRDADAAQDVVQNTFTNVIRKIGSYRGEAALFTWMCSFCRFEIAAYWRRKGKRAPEVELIEDSPHARAALETLGASPGGTGDRFEREELARMVWAVLDHLPVRYGNALQWKYIQGFSVDEIASRLGASQKAAESLLTRARQAFRDGFAAVAGE